MSIGSPDFVLPAIEVPALLLLLIAGYLVGDFALPTRRMAMGKELARVRARSGFPGGPKRATPPRLLFFRQKSQQLSGSEDFDIVPTVHRTIVAGISCHEGIGPGSGRHLEERQVVGVGQLHGKRTGEYGLAYPFDPCEHRTNVLGIEAALRSREHLSILRQDSAIVKQAEITL
ncbi:MAG: hypothetical protein WEG36_13070 [Gemmatimonadota bacterium]